MNNNLEQMKNSLFLEAKKLEQYRETQKKRLDNLKRGLNENAGIIKVDEIRNTDSKIATFMRKKELENFIKESEKTQEIMAEAANNLNASIARINNLADLNRLEMELQGCL